MKRFAKYSVLSISAASLSMSCAPMVLQQNVDQSPLVAFDIPDSARELSQLIEMQGRMEEFKSPDGWYNFSMRPLRNGKQLSNQIRVNVRLFESAVEAHQQFDNLKSRLRDSSRQPYKVTNVSPDKQFRVTSIVRGEGDALVFGHPAKLPDGLSHVDVQNDKLLIRFDEWGNVNFTDSKQQVIDALACEIQRNIERLRSSGN